MSNEDKMNIDERRKYLRQMQRRYRKAGRKARSQLFAPAPYQPREPKS